MRPTRLLLLLAAAGALSAADKPNREILELQRTVDLLQNSIKEMQQGIDQRVAAVTAQMQSMTESVGRLSASVDAVQKGMTQLAQDQERKIVPLVAAQGSRVDQAAATLSATQQAIAELTTAVNRLQTKLVDVENAVKAGMTSAAKPPMSAEDLLRSAEADRLGGKNELAIQGYADYVKQYGDTPMADTAQFQIGMLNYAGKNMEAAAQAFDELAQKYPDSKKVPEALLYKSKALASMGKGAESRAACQELRRKFASTEFARQCAVSGR